MNEKIYFLILLEFSHRENFVIYCGASQVALFLVKYKKNREEEAISEHFRRIYLWKVWNLSYSQVGGTIDLLETGFIFYNPKIIVAFLSPICKYNLPFSYLEQETSKTIKQNALNIYMINYIC